VEKQNNSYDEGNLNVLPFFMGENNPNLRELYDFMAYPFFSLSKRKTSRILFTYKKIEIKIFAPDETGIATIYDSDFLIWLTSQIANLRNRGIVPPQTILVKPSSFFRDTGRHRTGKEYRAFASTLERLKTTTIITNIKAGDYTYAKGFSWINSFETVKDKNSKMLGVKIELAKWFYDRCVKDKAYLSLDPAYFSLTRGFDRWLYGLARKYCGSNEVWIFKIQTLYKLYPNRNRKYRFFKHDLLSLVKKNHLPEYVFEQGTGQNSKDIIHISPRPGTLLARRLPRDMKDLAADLPF
jgi:plasmid replication initiation protein